MSAAAFDVIRAVEACYAGADGDRSWLESLLEALAPLDEGAGVCAFVFDVRPDGHSSVRCEIGRGAVCEVRTRLWRPAAESATAQLLARSFAPSPPVGYALKRLLSAAPGLAASARALLGREAVEDVLGICAEVPGRRAVVALGQRPGRRFPPRTLHQLALLAAHLTSAIRLRRAVAEAPPPDRPSGAEPDAVLDPRGHLLHARGAARTRSAGEGLAEAVRREERARGTLRRTDPEEALQLWQGLVDGTWTLVDHCEVGGRRYLLARRNAPSVRDPKALTGRERAVVSFAAVGHQDKYIGYLLGLSPSTVSGHLQSAQRKLGLTSRTELIRCLAAVVRSPRSGVP